MSQKQHKAKNIYRFENYLQISSNIFSTEFTLTRLQIKNINNKNNLKSDLSRLNTNNIHKKF